LGARSKRHLQVVDEVLPAYIAERPNAKWLRLRVGKHKYTWRLSDAWVTLAGQIEKDPHTVRQRNADLKQSHQTEPSKANTDTAQVAEILRERLQLSDSDEPKS
jgi:hypothetical protein